MKLKIIAVLALIITQFIVAQKSSSKHKNNNIIAKAGIAYGFRLGKSPSNISASEKQIIDNLSSGFVYDLGLYCRVSENAALGFKYNAYNASSPAGKSSLDPLDGGVYGVNDEISFYGFSYLLDPRSSNSKHEGNLELSAGYIGYKSTAPAFFNQQTYGSTFGLVGSFSYKYRVLEKLSVGPTLGFVGGTIKEFKVTANNGYSATITLPKDSYESLWRIDLGFEVIYRL